MQITFNGSPEEVQAEMRVMLGGHVAGLSMADFLAVLMHVARHEKVDAIKLVRQKTGLGLMESKQYCDKIAQYTIS